MVLVSFILHQHLVKMMPRLDVSMTFHSYSSLTERVNLQRKHHMQDFSLRRQTQRFLRTLIKRVSYSMLLSSSMIIHSVGDVIHHLSTMQENHGLLR